MKGKIWRRAGAVAGAAVLLCARGAAAQGPGAVRTGPDDARFDSVRAVIQRLVNEDSVPSITVAVAKDGRILWEEGFGWANRERGIAATPHTPYSLASVTKPITSTAVVVLSERGLIDLDAPIESYLGGLRLKGLVGGTRGVTARRAMAHSAGLPTHYNAHFSRDRVSPPEQTFGRYGIVVFEPGEQFEYSNIGYRALDLAIARVSGRSYGEFLREEIFIPLGMTRSAVGDPVWTRETAVRYDSANAPIPLYWGDTPGSGDVWASAHDMLRFGMMHVGTLPRGTEPVLRSESIRAMQRDVSPADSVQWGMGWRLTTDRGYRVVDHGGGQPGVSTQLTLYPDEGLVIVVLCNRDRVWVQDVARRIAAAVLPRARAGVDSTAQAAPPPPPDLAGRWAGTVTTHEGEMPIALEIQPAGDIHASLGTLFITSLVQDVERSGGALLGSFYGVVNTSDVLPHRHNVTFTLRPRGGEMTGQLTARGIDAIFGYSSFVRLRRLDTARLDEYVGVYRHAEDDLRTITREGDRLYSQRGIGRRYELQPLGEDFFLIVGSGGATLRFIRENGAVAEVDWNGRARARRMD
jgi:CubicO group peptidase (beta-lactamase class C family)